MSAQEDVALSPTEVLDVVVRKRLCMLNDKDLMADVDLKKSLLSDLADTAIKQQKLTVDSEGNNSKTELAKAMFAVINQNKSISNPRQSTKTSDTPRLVRLSSEEVDQLGHEIELVPGETSDEHEVIDSKEILSIDIENEYLDDA